MIIDLIFIGVNFFGALCGGILMRADDNILIKRMGTFVIIGATLFLVTYYVETMPEMI